MFINSQSAIINVFSCVLQSAKWKKKKKKGNLHNFEFRVYKMDNKYLIVFTYTAERCMYDNV